MIPVSNAKKLLSQLATEARHTPLQRLRNDMMAYLIVKGGLRTLEVGRAQIEHLQELVLSEKWRLWVHGKGRASADESVQVLREVYERIQSYLALRPGPLQGSDRLFATTACVEAVVTRAVHRIITEGLLWAGVKTPGIVAIVCRTLPPIFALLNDAIPRACRR